MRILILRSCRPPGPRRPVDAWSQEFNTAYAEKVIGNLRGEKGACAPCGRECIACREPYQRRFGEDIAAVVDLPAVMPHLLENPGDHVPADVPDHDVLLAIHVHEQVLIEFLRQSARWGVRGAVVPLEASDWISRAGQEQAERICARLGVEIAMPKPFCAFDPPAGGVLDEFRSRFHVGRPLVKLTVRDERIERAHVEVSAACGATYYVARWLAGKRVDDDLKYEVVSKRLHSYPCTASMAWDDGIGDTVMHVASKAHYDILAPLALDFPEATPMVRSPTGLMIPEPVPSRDNLQNIEQARQAILEDLAGGSPVSLESLRRRRKISSAAMYSAVLMLTQEGKVRRDGEQIVLA